MSASWTEANDHYLSLSLARLRLLLQRAADGRAAPQIPAAAPPPAATDRRRTWRGHRDPTEAPAAAPILVRSSRSLDEDLADAQQQIDAAAHAMTPAPVLESIRRVFGLSEFERDVLLLCAAPELDTGIGAVLEAAYGQTRPSFAVAMDALPDACWDARSPQRPLRYWGFIAAADEALSNTAPLRLDERILHALKGLDHLDARLASVAEPVPACEDPLPASQQQVADEAVDLLARAAAAGDLPLLQLIGPHASDRTSVAAVIAGALGLQLYCVRVSTLAALQASEIGPLARLWHRETLLAPLALLLDDDADDPTAAAGPRNAFVRRTGGLLLASAADLSPDLARTTVSFEVARPTAAEQYELWLHALGSPGRADVGVLAEQFRLDGPEIRRIVGCTAMPDEPQAATRALQAAARRALRPRLQKLASWVRPVATWDTLVLPETELAQLRALAEQVTHRSRVYSDWGFGARMNRGLGINALFAGESGTGKTMAAEVLANDLGLDLYRIDLAGVVDKYVGETPKHLRTLFDWGDAGEAILLIDECDAICGKRSEVKDAHDRYANIEIDYLLQRMETYRGVAILATNMRDAVDQAFLRRLRFVVNFPFPSASDRERMWRNVFPLDTPLSNLDYPRLAGIALTGAGIADAALAAAFRAAGADRAVGMADVFDATRAVLRKHNRPVNEADFRLERQGVPA